MKHKYFLLSLNNIFKNIVILNIQKYKIFISIYFFVYFHNNVKIQYTEKKYISEFVRLETASSTSAPHATLPRPVYANTFEYIWFFYYNYRVPEWKMRECAARIARKTAARKWRGRMQPRYKLTSAFPTVFPSHSPHRRIVDTNFQHAEK